VHSLIECSAEQGRSRAFQPSDAVCRCSDTGNARASEFNQLRETSETVMLDQCPKLLRTKTFSRGFVGIDPATFCLPLAPHPLSTSKRTLGKGIVCGCLEHLQRLRKQALLLVMSSAMQLLQKGLSSNSVSNTVHLTILCVRKRPDFPAR
jgi:hypothetical protein